MIITIGDNIPEPIYITTEKGQKIRILTPDEYDTFVAAIPIEKTSHLRTLFTIAFFTGMRYIELQRLYIHPEWVQKDRGVIYLPREAQLKVKRVTPERYIPIPQQISDLLPYFFKNKHPPVRKVWDENLKRWAVKSKLAESEDKAIGFVAKMTRASIESWMMAVYPEKYNWVCLRQGHDKLTSLNHYQAIPFKESEKVEIKRRLSSWIS